MMRVKADPGVYSSSRSDDDSDTARNFLPHQHAGRQATHGRETHQKADFHPMGLITDKHVDIHGFHCLEIETSTFMVNTGTREGCL